MLAARLCRISGASLLRFAAHLTNIHQSFKVAKDGISDTIVFIVNGMDAISGEDETFVQSTSIYIHSRRFAQVTRIQTHQSNMDTQTS